MHLAICLAVNANILTPPTPPPKKEKKKKKTKPHTHHPHIFLNVCGNCTNDEEKLLPPIWMSALYVMFDFDSSALGMTSVQQNH